MQTTLKTALFVLIWALIMGMQYNLDADKTATRQLKNAVEIAVHDAALAIDPLALTEGKIIFDEDQALDNFKASLEANLNVTSEGGYVYTTNEDSFYKNDIYLVSFDIVDDREPREYPFHYENPDYHIVEQINGPSIVAVITTESPHWFNGPHTWIRQAAVYEYRK